MTEPNQQLLRATSVRLHPECLEEIAAMVVKTGLSRSEIIRASIKVVSGMNVGAGQRLALVDVNNAKGPSHFKVTEWVDFPAA